MLEIYRTENKDVHRKVEILIERKIGKGFEIKLTQNGKPYIEGNPLYFSLSHSAGHAIIAVCDKPVGIDLEYYGQSGKIKNYKHVLKRFTPREQNLIGDSFVNFFLNWVSKEAYIKMTGGTILHDLKRLEYFDNTLYCDGNRVDCQAATAYSSAGVYSICADGYTREQLSGCRVKLFRLRKGEYI